MARGGLLGLLALPVPILLLLMWALGWLTLGWAEPTRTYATAHERHLLFSGPDPLKEQAMQQAKTKYGRSAYEQSDVQLMP